MIVTDIWVKFRFWDHISFSMIIWKHYEAVPSIDSFLFSPQFWIFMFILFVSLILCPRHFFKFVYPLIFPLIINFVVFSRSSKIIWDGILLIMVIECLLWRYQCFIYQEWNFSTLTLSFYYSKSSNISHTVLLWKIKSRYFEK